MKSRKDHSQRLAPAPADRTPGGHSSGCLLYRHSCLSSIPASDPDGPWSLGSQDHLTAVGGGRDVRIWGGMLSLPRPVLAFTHGRTTAGSCCLQASSRCLSSWESFPCQTRICWNRRFGRGSGHEDLLENSQCKAEASWIWSCFALSMGLSLFPGSRPSAVHSQTRAAAHTSPGLLPTPLPAM